MPSTSSERVSVNRRASVASLRAYASAPTAVAWNATRARDDDAARQHLGVDRLVDRVGLAGEQRLVDLEAVGGAHDAVGRDLVAGAQLEQVVEHDLLDRDLVELPVADDARLRGAQHGELVERALGPDLLDDPDQRVGDQDDAEQAVLRDAEDQDRRTSIAPRIALNRVKTLARTISP